MRSTQCALGFAAARGRRRTIPLPPPTGRPTRACVAVWLSECNRTARTELQVSRKDKRQPRRARTVERGTPTAPPVAHFVRRAPRGASSTGHGGARPPLADHRDGVGPHEAPVQLPRPYPSRAGRSGAERGAGWPAGRTRRRHRRQFERAAPVGARSGRPPGGDMPAATTGPSRRSRRAAAPAPWTGRARPASWSCCAPGCRGRSGGGHSAAAWGGRAGAGGATGRRTACGRVSGPRRQQGVDRAGIPLAEFIAAAAGDAVPLLAELPGAVPPIRGQACRRPRRPDELDGDQGDQRHQGGPLAEAPAAPAGPQHPASHRAAHGRLEGPPGPLRLGGGAHGSPG